MLIQHASGWERVGSSAGGYQYNTIQYNTIQYNTIQYNTIQWFKRRWHYRAACATPSLSLGPVHSLLCVLWGGDPTVSHLPIPWDQVPQPHPSPSTQARSRQRQACQCLSPLGTPLYPPPPNPSPPRVANALPREASNHSQGCKKPKRGQGPAHSVRGCRDVNSPRYRVHHG